MYMCKHASRVFVTTSTPKYFSCLQNSRKTSQQSLMQLHVLVCQYSFKGCSCYHLPSSSIMVTHSGELGPFWAPEFGSTKLKSMVKDSSPSSARLSSVISNSAQTLCGPALGTKLSVTLPATKSDEAVVKRDTGLYQWLSKQNVIWGCCSLEKPVEWSD